MTDTTHINVHFGHFLVEVAERGRYCLTSGGPFILSSEVTYIYR